MDTDKVPSDIVSITAGNSATQQISLRHDGAFGFQATLTMSATIAQAGNYGALYWYYGGALRFQDEGQVSMLGKISLTFKHASDYVIVYSPTSVVPTSAAETTPAVDTVDTPAAPVTVPANTSIAKSPQTGENTGAFTMFFLVMAATSGLCLLLSGSVSRKSR